MKTSQQKPKLLIVDDDAKLLASLQRALRDEFEILAAENPTRALELFHSNPDLALLDIRLDDKDASNQDGVELLKKFIKLHRGMPVVMTSAYADISIAVKCMKEGAVDFVEKTSGLQEIKQRLWNALEHGQALRRANHLEEYIARREPIEIIGEGARILEIEKMIKKVAQDGYISVLIRGETGTGKELVAKSIHRSGWRYKGPFNAVPVVSLPETIIESELFGHEAGAFTDAKKRKIGWIEKTDGGILFLDEIGDLPVDVQVRLLRFLEVRQFTRLGSTVPMKVDVQIISATHQDLEKAIEENTFREDLYFRLKGFQIDLPPLRERREDIPLLVDFFLAHFRKQGRTKVSHVSPQVMDVLSTYSWPGNIRELSMAVERAAVLFADDTQIELDDLSPEILSNSNNQITTPPISISKGINVNEYLARIELSCIEESLKLSKGRKTEAWKLLGLNDRFALRRRVNSILKKFPNLVKGFRLVSELFRQ